MTCASFPTENLFAGILDNQLSAMIQLTHHVEVTPMPLFPFPTRPVTDQVGWSYNGTLYCGDHEPDPYLNALADRVEPVFLSDVTHDDVCDICLERLEDYTLLSDGLGD